MNDNGVWQFSCTKFTCRVDVRDGRIVGAADIVRKFIGQPPANLARWATGRWGRCRYAKIGELPCS